MTDPWLLTYDGFDPAEEGLREALSTLGNGYFATRGADPSSSADGVHYPGTYVAGIYNRLESEVSGRRIENESIVNVPNWLVLRLAIEDGPAVDFAAVELLEYHQELDMRRGVLTRRVRFVDGHGRRTRFVERRFVHMRCEHLAGLETTVVAENWSGQLRVTSGIDGTVCNCGVARYQALASQHLELRGTEEADAETLLLRAETNQSHWQLAEAVRTRVRYNGHRLSPRRHVTNDEGFIAHELTVDLAQDDEVTIDKIAAVFSSRDRAISEPGLDATRALAWAGEFDELLMNQIMSWDHLWSRFCFELQLHEDILRIVRLHLFHILQTVSHNSIGIDVGVPPRGLHGEAYRGLVMWDELFILPILDLRMPELTRALLGYRFRRLPAARQAAREAGYRGAMFPWQSGGNGEEMSQAWHLNPVSGRWLPDPTDRQRHIGLGIAYNVWRYYEATGDVAFLADRGAELMLEIARFFASRASYDHGRDRYEICGVLGPDEFHTGYPDAREPGLNNNAYTNVMTAWLLARVRQLESLLPPRRWSELCDLLGLQRQELEHWEEVGRKLVVPFHDDVISQFEGYEKLEELDWTGLRERHGDIHRLDRVLEAEGDTTNRYKASKQADVLMLFYLFTADELRELFERLDYPLEPDTIPRTIDYYLRRTTHGSTLSAMVHAWVLARAHREEAFSYFQQALRSDIADIQGGTTPEGIHLGAMAGSVDLLQRCFTGLETRGDSLRLSPYWPEELGPLEFEITYRGHELTLHVTGELIRVASGPSEAAPIHVACDDAEVELRPGESVELTH